MKRKRKNNIKDRLIWAKSPTNGKWYPAYIVDKLWIEEYSTGDIWEAEEVSPIHKCPIPRRKYLRDNNANPEVSFEKEEMEVNTKVYLIIKTVAQVYNISISDIYKRKGADGVRDARNMVYYLVREHTNLTYPQIAATMQKKAHATIISGRKRVEGFLKVGDPYTTKKYEEIKRILNL